MANEEESGEIELEPVEEIEEIQGDDKEDLTDWKSLALKNQGIAKRYETKLRKIKEAEKLAKTEKKEPEKSQDKKEFDYAEKAYLKAMDIEKDEFPFVWDAIKSTGKSLEEILDSKYFQAELKEKRDELASKEALPSGTKRTSGSARDSVEYWLAKGQFPPDVPENRELRRKILAERVKVQNSGGKFTDRSIV